MSKPAAVAETPKPPPAIPAPQTRTILFPMDDKGDVSFEVSAEGGDPPCFSLGIRRSGSTLLHKMVNFLARRNGVQPVDLPGAFFHGGFKMNDWASRDLTEVILPGNVYIGFRSFPASFSNYPDFVNGRKAFMFRDPRDALVSQYFTDALARPPSPRDAAPGSKAADAAEKMRAEVRSMPIEDYVFKHARAIDSTMMAYAPMLKDPNCLCLRYEEFIFQKKRLIHKIMRHFDWTCPPGQVETLLKQVDEMPATEDQERFVRRVIPGDHRTKLSPEAIRKLNNLLREALHHFDYY